MSPLKPIINPVKFHSICISSLCGVVQTRFYNSFTSVDCRKLTTRKTIFLSNGHNSAKNHSIKPPVKYAQRLEPGINPLNFHLNCISTLGGVVRTTFKFKIFKRQ